MQRISDIANGYALEYIGIKLKNNDINVFVFILFL
jgi:hypothetical protein